MPNPRRNTAGNWEYRFTHNGTPHQLTRPTKTQALRDGEHLRNQITAGWKPDRRTLNTYYLQWLESRTDLATSTIDNYRAAHHILTQHPNMQLAISDIQADHVRQLITHLAAHVAPTTVPVYAAGLRQALNQAVDDHTIHRNPWRRITYPKTSTANGTKVGRILTPQEFAALHTAAGPHQLDLEVLVTTGLRFGEFAALQPADLNIQARTLTISRNRTRRDGVGPPKNRRSRIIPLSGILTDRLANQPDDPWMFPRTPGKPWDYDRWRYHVWTPTLRAAGLDGLNIHSLRHTAASWLLNRAHVDVRTVQQILGHSSLDITMRYLHTTPDHMARAAETIHGLILPGEAA